MTPDMTPTIAAQVRAVLAQMVEAIRLTRASSAAAEAALQDAEALIARIGAPEGDEA